MHNATTTTYVETEFSIRWIEQHGALFAQAYSRFFADHEGQQITAKARKNTITLVAQYDDID